VAPVLRKAAVTTRCSLSDDGRQKMAGPAPESVGAFSVVSATMSHTSARPGKIARADLSNALRQFVEVIDA
jgi:hypothetical protein